MNRAFHPSRSVVLKAACLLGLLGCGGDATPTPANADLGADLGAGRPDSGPIELPDFGIVPECGNGVLVSSEGCDDGNATPGDGCSETCSVEPNFVCVAPDMACIRVVVCGSGRIEGAETCDDGNSEGGDGCSADCVIEVGWSCPIVGVACEASACGDGLVAGVEACDDGDVDDGDGCSATCELESGYMCATPGARCTRTTCGDGIIEGTEQCDDGNRELADGCSPFCEREPDCAEGECVAVCGDSIVFDPEECDDGNVRDGDGCSASCTVEPGFTCAETEAAPPPSVQHPIVLRDFVGACAGRPERHEPGAAIPYGHPDFRCYSGSERGMVREVLSADGKPMRDPGANRISSDISFSNWFRPDREYSITTVQALTLDSVAPGVYRFSSGSFFPFSYSLDGSVPDSWVSRGVEGTSGDGAGAGQVNFLFTSELRYFFRYGGDEVLEFTGDDDVWVFVNGRLAVDLGGVHAPQDGSVTLADCAAAHPLDNEPGCLSNLDIDIGGIYEVAVFHAERDPHGSSYALTLKGFNEAPSICESTCGDGIQTRFEQCDEGNANGSTYGGCTAECLRPAFCGDGIVQEVFGEICDDGVNLGSTATACAPGCQDVGGRCGDGVVHIEQNEECDDGNTTGGDGCSAACTYELR